MGNHGRLLPVIASIVAALAALFGQLAAQTPEGRTAQSTPPILSRPDGSLDKPYVTLRVHDDGNWRFPITNWGAFGSPGGPYEPLIDPKTGSPLNEARFSSRQSSARFTMGALWVGALVETKLGNDTLVSTGHDGFVLWDKDTWITEFYPESFANGGDMVEISNDPSSPNFDPTAAAPEQFMCSFADTLTNQAYVRPDPATWKPHRPIYLRVRQSSYVWPYEYGEDLVIIQYWITNLRDRPIHDVRVGILANHEMVGFLRTVPSSVAPEFEDTVMAAWCSAAAGGAARGRWVQGGMRAAIGFRFLGVGQNTCGPAATPLEYSFNWWSPQRDESRADWGPQLWPGDKSIAGGYGQPLGDKQKFRYLANGEIDCDQHLANDTFPGWIPSPGIKDFRWGRFNLADGEDVRLLLSIGPFELGPGDSIPLGVAVVGGDLLHIDPNNGRNLNKNPEQWYRNLDFTDLGRNLQWAAWLYDNPGVDTDGDSCAGVAFVTGCRDTQLCFPGQCWEYPDSVICEDDFCMMFNLCDSAYYRGDGIPDLKGPPPPPPPKISIHTEPEKVHLRWEGRETELFLDPFVRSQDFEGYNVYFSRRPEPNQLSLLDSWDLVNFDRYRYVSGARPSPWVCNESPFTLEQLCALYGDRFNPHDYPDKFTFITDDQGNRFFFTPHGGNRGNQYLEGGVVLDNSIQYIQTDSVFNEARNIWQYFGHYECTIDNLLPSQPYYFAVTAFDQGLSAGGLGPLESSPQANLQLAYPTYTPDYVQENQMKVSVYPNPYKISDGYRRLGYEDPFREGFVERTRRIHFVNLPPKATIKIWSLDGDLIREINHPDSRFSDTPSHTAWDLITRNTQAVTSGIYLFSVESEWGTQIGKIVIIK